MDQLFIAWGDFGLGEFWLGGILTGGISSGGILARGDFVLGGFCPGGFCLGGFCPGGFCPGGFCPGGFCPVTVGIVDQCKTFKCVCTRRDFTGFPVSWCPTFYIFSDQRGIHENVRE